MRLTRIAVFFLGEAAAPRSRRTPSGGDGARSARAAAMRRTTMRAAPPSPFAQVAESITLKRERFCARISD
ncbi:hypothetical protein SZ29_14210 [Burkholderia pseudomallei]|nr:hypothetical protein SZ29_14210 [Burkholderia pseudomallei]